jgi:hypothetical protein
MKKIFYLVTLVIFSLLFVQCEEEPDGKGVHEGHEFVDLGLPSGLKWAAYNVGAESPEQSGDYFAWGEVEPKSYYFWNTYKYSGDKDSTFTKYCTDTLCGLNGFVDNKLQLEKSDLVQREGESLYRYNVSINKNDAPPTMVILDEISGFSQ